MVATAVRAQPFHLRTPLLKEGRLDTDLARTEMMTVRIKCYAQGGENALHTHPTEDHTFVILQGQARFWDADGNTTVLGRNDGIMLPHGAFYRFESCGDEPLVLLRVGASPEGRGPESRVAPDGHPIPGGSQENGVFGAPVALEGAFYE